MKALSMKQPVPELILRGRKTIELRHWNTRFKGEFFLHASMNELKGFGFSHEELKILPHGFLVGTANIVNVIEISALDEFKALHDKHLANDSWFITEKTFGFVLENPYYLEKPIPMKGQLGFFETGLELPKSKIKQSDLLKDQ